MKLLLLDDSQAFLAVARRLLTAAGHEVVVVTSWPDLMRVITRERPEAVIIDATMPVLDGPRIVEVVRRHWPTLPVLLMSGETDAIMADLVARSGADGYVQKLAIKDVDRVLAAATKRATGRVRRPAAVDDDAAGGTPLAPSRPNPSSATYRRPQPRSGSVRRTP